MAPNLLFYIQVPLLLSLLCGKFCLHRDCFRASHTDEGVKGWKDIGSDWTIRFRGYYFRLRE